MNFLTYLTSHPEVVLVLITSISGTMSAIAAVLPGVGENKYWNIARKIIDFIALNIGNAKNEKRNTSTNTPPPG